MGLLCMLLMGNDTEHLFLCLSITVYVPSLEKCLLLCPFFNWVFFLLLSHKSLLCVLDTKPLSDIEFLSIFFHSVAFLFTFVRVSLPILMRLSIFSLWLLVFYVSYLRDCCLIQGHSDSHLCVLLNSNSFSSYI